MRQQLLERLLRYVSFDTQADAAIDTCPSTPGQLVLAKQLKQELIELGLSDVSLDDNGYLMARLPSNVSHTVPAIGFIAHMDTAMDASGANVKPQLVEDYDGGDIALGDSGEVLTPSQYPELSRLIGNTLITTDGTTLLGADNKAGIAEILTAVAELVANPDIPHGDICIGFTPDEEIGRGAHKFDVDKFGAQWAYTIDGGQLGELEYENFNASSAVVTCHGVSVHPGTAKNKLVNSMNLAARLQAMMPTTETPETTEGYEGFYHLASMKPSIAKTEMHYILRDFDSDGMARRKAFMKEKVAQLNQQLSGGSVSLEITDSYFNMKAMVEPHQQIIDIAKRAMQNLNIEPLIKPIRGGTDGAQLSFKGLPCPNIFTGGYNFHGIHEYASLDQMELAAKTIVEICRLTAE
ncbi:peptidase T [Paraferrimonas sedimenticola]|uniref:Peptidase T n=1 Tax=Paraferrimonas sedimenticola TaxID=375674 RepID=A0AA37VZ92_9GAMM|nr:peptidase T [Paraferrimonas sedimenticola]GLP97089.1 peptidase T [Paraferrimonas sedimenticola]